MPLLDVLLKKQQITESFVSFLSLSTCSAAIRERNPSARVSVAVRVLMCSVSAATPEHKYHQVSGCEGRGDGASCVWRSEFTSLTGLQ